MAFEIIRPPTAFALSPGTRKRPRIKGEDHLRFIRRLPSLVSGARPVEACHIRYADVTRGKRGVGTGEKPDDAWCTPLTPAEHRDQHAFGDEREWWRLRGIDPIAVALALYRASGDEEAAELILASARSKAGGAR